MVSCRPHDRGGAEETSMQRKTCFIVVSAALATSAVANAGTISMTYVGEAAGRAIALHHDATAAWDADRANAFTSSGFAGARSFTFAGRSVRTFAVRFAESLTVGDSVSFAAVDPRDLPGGDPSFGPIGQLRADLLADLFGRYAGYVAGDGDPTLVAGFQLAIWEIMHENLTGPTREEAAAQLTLDLGAFQTSDAGDFDTFLSYVQANLMLASLANGPYSSASSLRGLSAGGPSDQLAMLVVPLPAPALLAAGGLLAAGSRRRSR
jgi:hypothetical protein